MDLRLEIDGKEISEVLKLNVSGNISGVSRTLEAVFLYDKTVLPGSRLKFYIDGKESFGGMVIRVKTDGKLVTAEAVDEGIYLTRNYAFKEYKGTANAIAKQVAAEFGIKCGGIESRSEKTKVTSPGTMTAFSVIKTAYEGNIGRSIFKRKFYIGMENGRLYIRSLDKCEIVKPEDDLISLGEERSIKDNVNRVSILSKSGLRERKYVENANERRLYGTFNRTYREKRGRNSTVEANKLLYPEEKTGRICINGDSRIVTGKRIEILNDGKRIICPVLSDMQSFTAEGYMTTFTYRLN